LTPKKLSQKPQRFFFLGTVCEFYVDSMILCGWSRYSDSPATVGGSAATKGAKSHLNAVFFMMHPNKDLQIAPTTILIYSRITVDFKNDG
jgi:hypothetical protein